MAKRSAKRSPKYGAKCKAVDLAGCLNWPRRPGKDQWWQGLAARVREYPEGEQTSWGMPFGMAGGKGPRVILVAEGRPEVTVKIGRQADFLCILHEWHQLPGSIKSTDPEEGLAVAEYELTYSDGTSHIQPVRGRFEVAMVESPGPPWLAVRFNMKRPRTG